MDELRPPAGFPTTNWSRVARAGDSTALAALCAAYWYPIYALIRRKGQPPDRALDLTQGYFARLIEKGTMSAADPDRGRFRTFLRADCAFFLADARDRDRALKRGGGARVVSIDAGEAETRFGREPGHAETPERRYERDWAVSLIDRAMGRLERHDRAGGRGEAFRHLKPILSGEPDAARLAGIAAEMGTTEGALRTALHRLRARFGAELRAEIAETLDDPTPEAVADELRDLFAALGKESRPGKSRVTFRPRRLIDGDSPPGSPKRGADDGDRDLSRLRRRALGRPLPALPGEARPRRGWADLGPGRRYARADDQAGLGAGTIAATIGAVPRVLLRDTAVGEEPSQILRPTPGWDGASTRYRIDGEIARGGMGAILRGRDPDLGRDVAIKVLREDLRHNDDLVRRFVEEAQIGGQLQHPGVVPIYELGTFADHRPFFYMKLVRGRTLADQLAGRATPADDLPRFLATFAAMAQTMAYAHTRGVIHRDLKPSNVMVGSFGEVQVMDWGLAKVLARGGVVDDARAGKEPPETMIATARSGSDTDLSHAGSILGTPSYMPPEQARGDIDRIDERADVFALGSILAEILTGSPAFTGRTSGEILRKASRGDTADALARLSACGAEAELIALAFDSLAIEPEDRPRDANAVSGRITGYLAGVQERVQAAERDRAVAEARAVEERKRRKVQLALAASILAITTMGGLGVLYDQRQRSDRAATVAKVVGEASTLRDLARADPEDPSRWRTALAALKQAEGVAGGDADAMGRIAAIRSEVQVGADAAERDRVLLDRLVDIRSAKADDPDGGDTDAAYAGAFRDAGLDLTALAPAEAGAKIEARPPGLALALAAALDDWSAVRRGLRKDPAGAGRLAEAARVADPDPGRNDLRAALAQPDKEGRKAALLALAGTAKLDELGPVSLDLLGNALADAGDPATAETVLHRAQVRQPGDVWVNFDLARVLAKLNRPADAIRFYTAARALRPETAHELAHALSGRGDFDEAIAVFRDLARLRPRWGGHLGCLGVELKRRGRTVEAATVLDEAVAALHEEIRLKPDHAQAHGNLGLALRAQGKHDEAVAALREAVRLRPDDANAYIRIATSLSAQGKHDEAVDGLRGAARLRPDDARIRLNLGVVLSNQGKHAEGAAETREAIRLTPDDAELHYNLAGMLAKQRKYDEAVVELRDSLRLKPDDMTARSRLGELLSIQGKFDEAIAAYRESLRFKPDDAAAHFHIASNLTKQGKLDEAAAEYREAIRLNPADAHAHYDLASVLSDRGKHDEAIAAYREVVRLKPDSTFARHDPSVFPARRENLDDTVAALREAIRAKPEEAPAHSILGSVLRSQGKLDDAVAAYRGATRIRPDDHSAHFNLAGILNRQRKLDEAAAEYREAIRTNPGSPNAHYDLGGVLRSQGEIDGAVAEFREALRIKPELARDHINLGNTLRLLGKLDDAEASYREAIKIQPDDAQAHGNLGTLLGDRGDYRGSLAMIRKSHELATKQPGQGAISSAARVAEAEWLVALADRLPALLEGEDRPKDNAERSALAQMCLQVKHPAANARFFGEALEADPKIADDLQTGQRYNAARAAALAGTGAGEDDPPPDEAAKAKLRGQALGWLQAELAAWARSLESGPAPLKAMVAPELMHWKADPDLAGVRDPDALAGLPEGEREGWRSLWAEVDALIKRAEGP